MSTCYTSVSPFPKAFLCSNNRPHPRGEAASFIPVTSRRLPKSITRWFSVFVCDRFLLRSPPHPTLICVPILLPPLDRCSLVSWFRGRPSRDVKLILLQSITAPSPWSEPLGSQQEPGLYQSRYESWELPRGWQTTRGASHRLSLTPFLWPKLSRSTYSRMPEFPQRHCPTVTWSVLSSSSFQILTSCKFFLHEIFLNTPGIYTSDMSQFNI